MQRFPLDEAPRMDIVEAKAHYDRGDAVFADVRSRANYEQAHIPGARSIPVAELRARASELPRDRPLILY